MVMIGLLPLFCPRVAVATALRSLKGLAAGGQAQPQALQDIPGRRRGDRCRGRTRAWTMSTGHAPALVPQAWRHAPWPEEGVDEGLPSRHAVACGPCHLWSSTLLPGRSGMAI